MHNRPRMRPRKSLTWILRGVYALAVTAGLGLAGGCGGAEDNRPQTWDYIYPAIIEPSCATASCHSAFAERSGVNLGNIDDAYDQLVGRHFVVPNNVAQSGLINLLNANGARRMPPDFALPKVDIDLISNWITNGAPAAPPAN